MTTKTILTDEEIMREYHRTHAVLDFARAIEQAVLQSPEIQALKRDSERLDWLADAENSIGSVHLPTCCVERNPRNMRDAIDEAMDLGIT